MKLHGGLFRRERGTPHEPARSASKGWLARSPDGNREEGSATVQSKQSIPFILLNKRPCVKRSGASGECRVTPGPCSAGRPDRGAASTTPWTGSPATTNSGRTSTLPHPPPSPIGQTPA